MAGEREGGVAGGIAKPRSHTLHNLYAAAAETADSAEAPWEHLHVAFWETWMADSGSVTTKQVLSEIMSLHTRTHRFITFMQTTFHKTWGSSLFCAVLTDKEWIVNTGNKEAGRLHSYSRICL